MQTVLCKTCNFSHKSANARELEKASAAHEAETDKTHELETLDGDVDVEQTIKDRNKAQRDAIARG